LCERMLALENHYLTLHREYLLMELSSGDDERIGFALERLGMVRYVDDEMLSALETIEQSNDEMLRQTARETIQKFRTSIH